MSESFEAEHNEYVHGPMGKTFVKTAIPIILVMLVNGTFAPVDAYFLGKYVGSEELTAVTLMFPIFMFLIALSTLVAAGYSSVLSRLLGQRALVQAGAAYVQAHGLALLVCAALILTFWLFGKNFTYWAANGSAELAASGYSYISLMIFWSPLAFVMALNMDTLRGEGRISAMTSIVLLSAFLNIGLDYLYIAKFEMGVTGSAIATLSAQSLALLTLLIYRMSRGTRLRFSRPEGKPNFALWREILALGSPTSLGYVGIALSTGLTIFMLQKWAVHYDVTAGAFGISTRVMTFLFLPLLGLSFATQSIIGNNYGARQYSRSSAALKIAVGAAVVYCAVMQVGLFIWRNAIGMLFVDDAAIVAELARILPLITLSFVLFGPLMMIGTYFQAIGDARRAIILGLSRTYIFGLPLLALLPLVIGELGIWVFGAVAEVLVLVLTIIVLRRTAGMKSLLSART